MELFTIKGLKSGPTFFFDDQASFPDVVHAVEEELARANGFFRDSPVVLHFGGRLLQKEEWRELKEVLHQAGLLLRYAVTTVPQSQDLLYREGLIVRDALILPTPEKRSGSPEAAPTSGALYLRRSLRSGQKEVFDGDVMLVGDVNQGAEILASGDVVVFGTIRGVVHAGYPDMHGAVVVALNLTPLQLRIGPFIARPEEGQTSRRVQRPEVARVKDKRIMIEPYQGKL